MKKQNVRKHSPIHPSIKVLSLILGVLLFFSACPPISFALSAGDEIVSAEQETATAIDATEEITYTEIPEKRDAFTKHFKRSDGKYVAIVYPEAVHTIEDGEYVNLDNRLVPTTNGRYQTVNDDFRVSFAPNASEDQLISLSFEGYTLSWGINIIRKPDLSVLTKHVALNQEALNNVEIMREAANQNSIAATKAVAVTDANERLTYTKTEIESTFMATSGMTYQNAFSQNGKVDLVYTVSNNRLEEDIIVKEKGNIHSYVVTMNAPELTAVLGEDNSVVFYDSNGKDVFTIGAPWMCDAVYALSHDITVSLRQAGDTVTIVYTPDADWMNAPERVYPVLIDPSVRSRNYTANYQDTFVFEGDTANSARANVNYMRIGKTKDGSNEAYIKLLKYPMLIDAVTFHSATLTVFGGNVQNMKMKTVKEAWDQTTITYATRPQDSLITRSETGELHSGTTYRFCYDFTSEVVEYGHTHMNWMGYFTSYLKGFHLFCDPVGSSVYSLRSSEHTDTTLRPYVEIVYEYAHDIPIVNNGIYNIRNAASEKSITNSASSTNVYQYYYGTTNVQAFRFLGGNGVFEIESVLRPGEVLTYDYSGSNAQSTSNVYMATNTTSLTNSQEWMLQYVEDDEHGYHLYAIVSQADTTMALTAVGTSVGTASGTSVTATGNIIASTFTGADSQLWYLESGSKPVYAGNNIELRNGDTLRFNYGVGEPMIQPYYAVKTYGDRITWSSSDPDVVSIATNGKVTINNLGKVTLTATITDVNSSLKGTYSYTVIIGMPNGVYRIKNVGTGKYLGIPGTTYASGKDAVVTEKYTTGMEQYGQLWKIYHIGDGIYSIRVLPKLDRGLRVNPTNDVAELYAIGLNDSRNGVADHSEWDIRLDDSGNYLIYNYYENTTTLLTGNDDNTVTITEDTGTTSQLWQFEEYPLNGGLHLLSDGNEVGINDTLLLKPILYFEELHTPLITSADVEWSSSNIAKATVSDTGIVTGVDQGTVNITGSVTIDDTTFTTTIPIQVLKKAIIIVPGIMGSKLIAGEDISISITTGDELWSDPVLDLLGSEDRLIQLAAMERISALEMNSNLESKYVVNIVSDDDNGPDENRYGVNCEYQYLFTELDERYGEWYDIRFFNYDWRLSNSVSAESLASFINTNNYDKVVLIAHSMGGLVVSKFLANAGLSTSTMGSRVENCVFLASPLLGSPLMTYILGSGDISDIIPTSMELDPSLITTYNRLADYLSLFAMQYEDIPDLLINMPSIYELMPSQYYFNRYVGESALLEHYWYLSQLSGASPIEFETFAQTRQFLINNTSLNSQAVASAYAFHHSLWSSSEQHVTMNYSSYYMVGTNCDTALRVGVDLNEVKWNVTLQTLYGDGKVPVRSAALGFLAEDTTVYQAQDHNALLKTAATITFISRIIDGSAITGINGLSYIDPVP